MSPSSAPPARTLRKRPWYLVVALVIASVFGASSFIGGTQIISYYRDADDDMVRALLQIDDGNDRAAVQAAIDRRHDVLDATKARMFPLGAAELLLGMALFALSAGAMAGRGGARSALVQVLFVQSLLVVAMFFMTARFRAADGDLDLAVAVARLRQQTTDPEILKEGDAWDRRVLAVRDPAWLTLRSVVAGMMLIALTRKRSLAYYEPVVEA